MAVGARSRADKFGAGVWGEAAGLLHDLGKYSAEFQARLAGDPTSVDHSTAGAQVARQRYGIAGHLIAAGVAGHHAGLSNGTGTGERTPLTVRLAASVPDYAAWQCEIALPATLTPPRLTPHPTAGRSRAGLQLATLSRMIFGALVDADWADTTAFYNGGYVEPDAPSLETLRDALDGFLAELQKTAAPSRLNDIRARILATACKRASKPRGVFTMTVPTGGGKTLAGLAFVLDHALEHALIALRRPGALGSASAQLRELGLLSDVGRFRLGTLADIVQTSHYILDGP